MNNKQQTAVDFVPYELALELKQIGFNEPCLGIHYYKESYPMLNPQSGETELVFEFGQYIKQTEVATLAPTFSQAFRWFREKHGLCLVIKPIDDKRLDLGYNLLKNGLIIRAYTTYEKAELACLRKLIEIVNEGTK
jgi:hypothetical protein